MSEMLEEVSTGKIVFIPETLVDMANNHGKDAAREVFHDILNQWIDRYLGEEE